MAPIRVLQVVGKMHYGGMETLIMNLYRNIDREKIQFDFMVHYPQAGAYDEEIRRLGGKIYVMPRTVPQNAFKYKKALKNFFSEHKEYKIVHGHLHSTAFLYHSAAKKYGGATCCITHSHANNFDKNIKSILAYYLSLSAQKQTDVFMGCSREACEFFFPKAVKAGREMIIVKNGIQSALYEYSQKTRDAARKELKLSSDELIIGHVGRFFPPKNHGFLISIFNELHKLRPNSKLLLIGEGPLQDNIRGLVKSLNLQDSIIFLGTRDDVNILLQAIDVFVLPSLYEGLGIVLIEAQASGLRCLASDTVAQEAKITPLLDFLSLDLSAQEWAKRVLAAASYERTSPLAAVRESGFDISTSTEFLQNFYLKNC